MNLLKPFLFSIIFILSIVHVTNAAVNQPQAIDDQSNIGLSLNAGFCDKYLWRGITYNEKLVFQPEVELSYKDFYVAAWGNFGLMKETESFHEIDFTLGYYHSFNSFAIESYLSYFFYINQLDAANTAEFNLGLYYPIGDFSLFARSSFDVLSYFGAMFGEIGTDYEKEISDHFSVSGTLLAGFGSQNFNETYLSVNKSAINLVGGKVGISYSPFDDFYINADFLLNFNINNDIKESIGSTSNLFEIILRKEF
jgi:hypothetical protein